MTEINAHAPATPPLGVVRCAATGAVVLAVNFALCWAATALNAFPASHMFVALFTTAPEASGLALGIGLCAALAFGALTGAMTAMAYNLFRGLEPR
jgi:hypothetical protein